MATNLIETGESRSGKYLVSSHAVGSGGRGRVLSTLACRAAATLAAETYGKDEVERHAQVIGDAWKARLQEQTKRYLQRYLRVAAGGRVNGEGIEEEDGEQTEAAEPVTVIGGLLYPWWNILLAGPFQLGLTGPFLPSKIIRYGEPAFMLAALWRNPAPLAGGPSAAAIMSPFTCRLYLETVNLTNVTNGPDFGPFDVVFGGGFVNVVFISLTGFAAPAQGRPTLYEMHAVADILGPGVGLPPFAGFSTWLFDPDYEPPFFAPAAPGGLQHDQPARFAIYV
jgi:hypothetical protein